MTESETGEGVEEECLFRDHCSHQEGAARAVEAREMKKRDWSLTMVENVYGLLGMEEREMEF